MGFQRGEYLIRAPSQCTVVPMTEGSFPPGLSTVSTTARPTVCLSSARLSILSGIPEPPRGGEGSIEEHIAFSTRAS